ncbi:MAG: encapsulin [Archaeoglobaceae archaeon]|nr:encapsulin [Archaeoglobaceae archaeon]MCX8151481.1 encapsulin [Archaeoglobaceae archaeon]MDW8014243.1 family 1 encapsulin nanocompartment shell protein [Archaeoglobaceae archaeon]
MLAINPTLISRDKPYSKEELMEALRLAAIAELDAVNLYEQMARYTEDERFKKVFLDVAAEEKVHVGEFMSLLFNLDPEQVEKFREGFKEVEELTGIKTESNVEKNNSSYLNVLKRAFVESVERSRVLMKYLPKTKVVGQSVRVDVIGLQDGVRVLEHVYKAIPLLTEKFYVGIRELTDGSYDVALAAKAGEILVRREEKLVVDEMISNRKVVKVPSWEGDDALNSIMSALSEVSKVSSGPFAIIINPERFSKLLKVHEKSGKMLIEILKEIFRGGIIVTPNTEKAIVFANTPSVLDVVVGQEIDLKELGPEGEQIAFLVSEALTVRVKNPSAIVVLE